MNIILSLIIACTIALGAPAQPSQPDTQPSQPASQPASIECMEDMECWDSASMGNLQAGTDNETDAYDVLSTWNVQPAQNQALEYVETLDYLPTSFPIGYFAVTSKAHAQTYHIMRWVTLYKA